MAEISMAGYERAALKIEMAASKDLLFFMAFSLLETPRTRDSPAKGEPVDRLPPPPLLGKSFSPLSPRR